MCLPTRLISSSRTCPQVSFVILRPVKYEPVKSEFEIPMLGPIVLVRSTKEQALSPGPIAQLPDLGMNQLIRLKGPIPDAHRSTAAVYRVTVRGDDNVATTFSHDARQQVKNVRGNSFELHVRASGKPTAPGKAAKDADAASANATDTAWAMNFMAGSPGAAALAGLLGCDSITVTSFGRHEFAEQGGGSDCSGTCNRCWLAFGSGSCWPLRNRYWRASRGRAQAGS